MHWHLRARRGPRGHQDRHGYSWKRVERHPVTRGGRAHHAHAWETKASREPNHAAGRLSARPTERRAGDQMARPGRRRRAMPDMDVIGWLIVGLLAGALSSAVVRSSSPSPAAVILRLALESIAPGSPRGRR